MLVTDAANIILREFTTPESLPDPLPTLYIRRKAQVPCRSWSWQNRMTMALHGHADARSYDQWKQVGRYVRRGEKAFYIEPQPEKRNSKWAPLTYGPRGAAVFGLSQTEGKSVPNCDIMIDRWLRQLPLRVIADCWGVSVEAYNGVSGGHLGCFSRRFERPAIALGAENRYVWAHELIHAADYRTGNHKELHEHWRSETVAAFGGAILLKALGYDQETDLGGGWQYIRRYVGPKKMGVVKACNLVLERTCEAVNLILNTAHDFRAEMMWEKIA